MDQVDNLILNVQGKDKLESLNAELAKEQKALQELAAGLRTGAIAQAAFDAAAQTTAKNVLALEGQMKQLAGSPGLGGNGILQASWAVQDFTSVLAGGQGLGRAIASVQNNIPGLLMSLGMSGGIAGAVSLVSVGIGALLPLVEKMWGSLDNKEAAESAKERLREIKAAADEVHKAFMSLAQAPTDPEKLAVEGIGLVLKERPKADMARQAIAEGFTPTECMRPSASRSGMPTGRRGTSPPRPTSNSRGRPTGRRSPPRATPRRRRSPGGSASSRTSGRRPIASRPG